MICEIGICGDDVAAASLFGRFCAGAVGLQEGGRDVVGVVMKGREVGACGLFRQSVSGVLEGQDVDGEIAGENVGVPHAGAQVFRVLMGVQNDEFGVWLTEQDAGDAVSFRGHEPDELGGMHCGKSVLVGDDVSQLAVCALVGADCGGAEEEMGVELSHVFGFIGFGGKNEGEGGGGMEGL